MRYGKTLQQAIYPPWRDNYIDYTKLKKLLRDDDSSTPSSPSTETVGDSWTDDDESKFVDELVNVQLEKVHAFHKETYEKLRDRTARCEARLDTVAVAEHGVARQDQAEGGAEEGEGEGGEGSSNGNGKKAVPSEDEKKTILTEVLAELDLITRETNELEKYSRINYTGFLKAVKKHDRKRGASYRVRPLLQVRLAALPFNTEDYSPLLYRLSAMYSFVRQRLEGAENRGLSVTEKATEGREEYISHKFWVHPENLLEVKTMILRRLPVLVYNPQSSRIAEGTQPDPSMTSIYFDNPAFALYTDKVDEGEASSLRLRWYGQLNEKSQIWVEKKTIKADDLNSEQRITTKEKYIQRFIKGEHNMEKQIQKLSDRAGAESPEAKSFRTSVKEIQEFIAEKGLQPVLRANYTRTAFQIPGDDRVRISLDTDLAFIREDAIDNDRPCRDPESWHRTDIDNQQLEYPFTSIRKGEVNRFPFALLEIKVRHTSNHKRSEWIQDLMNSHLVTEAPRFSKFVHGVAMLFEDYVNTFPFWLPQVETDIRRDPQRAFEEEQDKRQKAVDDEFAVGSLLKTFTGRTGHSQSQPRDMISPVGSPAMTGALGRSPAPATSMTGNRTANYGTLPPTMTDSQTHDTPGEPDDDEMGPSTTMAAPAPTSTLKSLFPHFSTSKYAASRRGLPTPTTTPLPPGITKPTHWLKDAGPLAIEPKVWLANQRTFIKWQHVSVLLASLSLGLYNAAREDNWVARALGVVYVLLAVGAGGWGYGVYVWRCRLIERRSGGEFDGVVGPVGVCLGLVVALMVNFGLKYRAIRQDRDVEMEAMLGFVNQNLTQQLVGQW
ncbi:Phosphate metabolism transcription protein [Friedmanniomyces endolithicus]|nr:Phosphate metabolism transcription protein [Friedmanniomyces endolithicus]